MHLGIKVDLKLTFPLRPQQPNPRRIGCIVRFVEQIFLPDRKLRYAFSLTDDAIEYGRFDATILIHLPEFLQLKRHLIAEDFRSLKNGFVKLHVLVSVQGIMVDEVFQRRLSRQIMLQLVQHTMLVKGRVRLVRIHLFVI